jgi:hypothetical protein
MTEKIVLREQSVVKIYHTPFDVNSLNDLGQETCWRLDGH